MFVNFSWVIRGRSQRINFMENFAGDCIFKIVLKDGIVNRQAMMATMEMVGLVYKRLIMKYFYSNYL